MAKPRSGQPQFQFLKKLFVGGINSVELRDQVEVVPVGKLETDGGPSGAHATCLKGTERTIITVVQLFDLVFGNVELNLFVMKNIVTHKVDATSIEGHRALETKGWWGQHNMGLDPIQPGAVPEIIFKDQKAVLYHHGPAFRHYYLKIRTLLWLNLRLSVLFDTIKRNR